jgi:acyl carrier protein
MISTLERVKAICVETLGLNIASKIRPEARFREDMGADSLDGVEIVMAIEEEFGVEIHDDAIEAMNTVGELVALVDRLMRPAS